MKYDEIGGRRLRCGVPYLDEGVQSGCKHTLDRENIQFMWRFVDAAVNRGAVLIHQYLNQREVRKSVRLLEEHNANERASYILPYKENE